MASPAGVWGETPPVTLLYLNRGAIALRGHLATLLIGPMVRQHASPTARAQARLPARPIHA